MTFLSILIDEFTIVSVEVSFLDDTALSLVPDIISVSPQPVKPGSDIVCWAATKMTVLVACRLDCYLTVACRWDCYLAVACWWDCQLAVVS